MGKASKEFQWRMEGMIFAYNVVKKAENAEEGLKALKNDIKMRGFTMAPLRFTNKEIDEYLEFLSKNLYATMSAVTLMTLNDEFGFGKLRLDRFKERFDKNVAAATDFSYLGDHFATLEDYAIYLNKKFDTGLDVERIAMCQDNYSKEQDLKGKADVNEIINLLKENGHENAAEFIKERIA